MKPDLSNAAFKKRLFSRPSMVSERVFQGNKAPSPPPTPPPKDGANDGAGPTSPIFAKKKKTPFFEDTVAAFEFLLDSILLRDVNEPIPSDVREELAERIKDIPESAFQMWFTGANETAQRAVLSRLMSGDLIKILLTSGPPSSMDDKSR